MNWFTTWLKSLDRQRMIYRDVNEKYLERFYLLRNPVNLDHNSNFNCFLHRFIASDNPVYHTHPWKWWLSWIIKGEYLEHLEDGTVVHRKRWSVAIRRGTSAHWVELIPGKEVWTIFLHGKRTDDWGFIVDGKLVPHKQYLKNPKKYGG